MVALSYAEVHYILDLKELRHLGPMSGQSLAKRPSLQAVWQQEQTSVLKG